MCRLVFRWQVLTLVCHISRRNLVRKSQISTAFPSLLLIQVRQLSVTGERMVTIMGGVRWLSGSVSDSGAKGRVRNLPPPCCVLEQHTLLPESTG